MNELLLQVEADVLETALNNTWILLVSFLIFFMHAGFAMLEAGQVRSKNVANQLTKNLLTWSVGVTVFFLVGSGLAYVAAGLGGFGEGAPFLDVGDGAVQYISWFYGAVFAMTAATIVSGAVAGRAKLRAYVGYTFLLAAVIYPITIAFTWTPQAAPNATGLVEDLTGTAFHDFAGGMIVHALGGIAGLTAAWVLGARMDRYNDDGSLNVIPGHSMTFAVLGTLILAFGWYGFNVGTAAVFGDGAFLGDGVGRVVMTTTLSMAMGAVGAGAVSLLRNRKVDTLYVANGLLAGLVGITAIPDVATWWGALAVGLIAGAQLPIVFGFVEKNLKVDDVCAVFPVHGTAGVIGALAMPFVHYDLQASFADAFIAQVAGIAIITAWTVTATGVVWYVFKLAGQARVTEAHERDGLDSSEHGVETYPEFGQPNVATDSPVATDGGVPAYDLRTDGGGSGIEMVTAIVRPDKLGDVKRALAEAEAPSLTVTNVSGRGSQPAKKGQWRGEEYVVDLHQKVKVECVVADTPTQDVVSAIQDAASTGEPGDGKIFIAPIEDAVQIRTGNRGTEAV